MHPVLERQLRRLGIDPEGVGPSDDSWAALCERVSRAYTAADQERYLLERSLRIASDEMRELYDNLKLTSEQRYLEVFESANDAIFTIGADEGFTSVNRACEELTGFRRDELVGRPWRDLAAPESHALLAEMIGRRGAGERFEVDIIASDGRRIPLEIRSRLLVRDGVPGEVLGVGRDISERRQHEARLTHLAQHDELTGLPNRTILEGALSVAIADAAHGKPMSLALLDLDDFKLINDTLGHAAGDQVLVTVASLLRTSAPDLLIVRLSGDEFALVLSDREGIAAAQTAERVRQSIEQADVRIAGERVFLSASIGIVPIGPLSQPGALLAEADAAMYIAKDGGRNQIFLSGSQDAITHRLTEVTHWAKTLRAALESRSLEVHYQPVVRLEGGVGHYEALVRLRGADGELVYPGTFLPAAERFGLMPALDRFVLDVVLDRLRRDPKARVFVNLSAPTLADRQLMSHLLSELRREPRLGPQLGLEITETALLRDLELARQWIDVMRTVGCEFALDDFGTGFNSLTYVRLLPVAQIKIDGSFVTAIASDPTQLAVVAAVKVLADGLGMETVAECIETPEALAIVRSLGITYGQGFLLGRPRPEFVESLRAA